MTGGDGSWPTKTSNTHWSNNVKRYRLKSDDEQAALDRQRSLGVGDLADEIALTRSLIERAVDAGHVALASGLLTTLGKLTTEYEKARIRSGDLLPREDAVRLGQLMAGIVPDVLRDARVPEWELLCDEVIRRVERAPLLLTDERNTHE
jgi:hypothetical protein